MKSIKRYGDSEPAKPPEFTSQEARDAWQIATYGHVRNGFREPDEPPDGRPVIVRDPYWRDPAEQDAYEHAVRTNPRRPDEGAMTYIARIAAIVEGRLQLPAPKAKQLPPAKPMPPKQRQLTDGQWNDRANELERQVEQIREPGEDG